MVYSPSNQAFHMGFYLTYASQPSKAARQNPTKTEGFEDMRLKIILHVVCKNATFRCRLSLCVGPVGVLHSSTSSLHCSRALSSLSISGGQRSRDASDLQKHINNFCRFFLCSVCSVNPLCNVPHMDLSGWGSVFVCACVLA